MLQRIKEIDPSDNYLFKYIYTLMCGHKYYRKVNRSIEHTYVWCVKCNNERRKQYENTII